MTNLGDILNSKHMALIGSDADNDFVLNDPEVSGKHCQITKISESKYMIVDLGSATGTFVNNKKIDNEFITETDFISVGSQIFQLGKKVIHTEVKNETEPVVVDPVIHSTPVENIPSPQTSPTLHKKVTVYFLAAPEDESVCRAIDKHLAAVRFNSAIPIEIYGDFKIPPGDDIAAYKQKLFEADVVLAFISVDFINNNECYERNQKVIVKYNKGQTILLPILVRNCMWKATPFANLPLLPKNLQPLNNKQFWNSEDDALMAVVTDIYNSINDFTDKNTHEQPVKNTIPLATSLKVDWRKDYFTTVFWKRVAAYILDLIIVGIPLVLVLISLLEKMVDENTTIESAEAMGFILGFTGQLIVCALLESSKWRATPGKLIMKLQITDNEGHPLSFQKALFRNFLKLIMNVFYKYEIVAYLYYAAQGLFFIKNKKFIHDQLSHTVIGEKLN